MYHLDGWKDPGYLAEKLKALQADPRHWKYEWRRRDIMPKCVLSLARTWFPDPDRVPYMGSFMGIAKKVSEYDQEIPQSQTADNPVAPRGRAAQPSRDTRKTN